MSWDTRALRLGLPAVLFLQGCGFDDERGVCAAADEIVAGTIGFSTFTDSPVTEPYGFDDAGYATVVGVCRAAPGVRSRRVWQNLVAARERHLGRQPIDLRAAVFLDVGGRREWIGVPPGCGYTVVSHEGSVLVKPFDCRAFGVIEARLGVAVLDAPSRCRCASETR